MKTMKNRLVAGAAAVLTLTAAVVGGVAAPASAGTYAKTYYASSGTTATGGVMCGILIGKASADLKKLGFVITSYTCDAKNKRIEVKYTEANQA